MHIHDLIGVGFGPSNLALAIALEEAGGSSAQIDSCYIEKQPHFAWHADMMLDDARMQISFLKDLVTLRNPMSRYTFLNYLHQSRRLQDFINLKTFYPSRHEFNDYLRWAAQQFASSCFYGEEAFELLPEKTGDHIDLLHVRSRRQDGSVRDRLTRNLVIGVGGAPNIPPCMTPLMDDPRIFHSSRYLGRVGALRDPGRVAVVGVGQSAAEVFIDLHKRFDAAKVDLITRARAIKPSDDSPFVNEIFNAEYTDYVFERPAAARASLIEEFMNTNYAAPDLELVEMVYGALYLQKVRRQDRLRFLRRHEILDAGADDDGVWLRLQDQESGAEVESAYDAVVLATGYTRKQHQALLEPVAPYLVDFSVDRNYRMRSRPGFAPAIFLQGSCESTHGLADTLLSVMAIRSEEIRTALLQTSHAKKPEPPLRAVASS